ncbi:aminotransferase class I/II-fold pyridoxal phosphate-dependent enzyme [Streptomyces sp. NA04227]|uniref:aminotransferase class I/II-fold pyridoxal phosphate-dependent enzyme n=1 Tax=Streptomyces sp. NA04227 TaxID=2742136 RepID=UPI001592064B|nr:aminotransferase class I/II-fold pyridoxal phosphate-dependent enzyme [Streptomyces sp. NA04227]QKW10164.1 aminotransferase class I/II-fold pyridoxal phosphate-dependent enzyme [Streptomyces sp. NA04227]
MRRSDPGARPVRGQVRYGPQVPGTGLPVLDELVEVFADAARSPRQMPPGGGPGLLGATCGYWERRGLAVEEQHVVAAPGAGSFLIAFDTLLGGDVLLPRPCPAHWAPQVRLLGRPAFPVPTPAESGGVPDPYALLETVRRLRAEGRDPKLLVLCVADDPTATVPPPEQVHETLEAAVSEGLHIVSDETWRDTLHHPDDTVFISPAEMLPPHVTVISDLSGAFLPPSWPAAVARFPATGLGTALRARTLDVLTALGATLATPVAAAAAHALEESPWVTRRMLDSAHLHARVAAELGRAVAATGVLVRPPQAGRHLYADLAPLRGALDRHGVGDAQELEDFLESQLGMPAPGGHRFGDDPASLRVRLSTGPLLGRTDAERAQCLTAADPLTLPAVRRSLSAVRQTFTALAADDGPPAVPGTSPRTPGPALLDGE